MTPPDPVRSDPVGATPDLLNLLIQTSDALDRLRAEVEAASITPRDVASGLAQAIDGVRGVVALIANGQSTNAFALTSASAVQAASALLDSLTPRERQVADAVLAHGTTARAAHALDLSEATVGHHRSNILRKLKAANFVQVGRLIGAVQNR